MTAKFPTGQSPASQPFQLILLAQAEELARKTLTHKDSIPTEQAQKLVYIFEAFCDFELPKQLDARKLRTVLGALTHCYVLCNDSELKKRITDLFKSSQGKLEAYVSHDVELAAPTPEGKTPETVQALSLDLASNSVYFQKLFDSRWKEGLNFSGHYATSRSEDQDNVPIAEIKDVPAVIIRAWTEIIKAEVKDPFSRLSPANLIQLLQYADMTETLPKLSPGIENHMIKVLADAQAGDWLNVALEYGMRGLRDACLKKIFLEAGSMDELIETIEELQKNMEYPELKECIIKVLHRSEVELAVKIRPENIREFYEFSKKQGLENLYQECLQRLAKTILEKEAYEGLANHFLKGIPWITVAEVRLCCHEALLSKLGSWLTTLNHQWDPVSNKWESKSTKTKDIKQAIASLEKFATICPQIKAVKGPHFETLHPRELGWLLQILPHDMTELNLTNSPLDNTVMLRKFRELESLNLNGCKNIKYLEEMEDLRKLKRLDLGNCSALLTIAPISALRDLVDLNLYNCKKIYNLSYVTSLPKLQILNIKGCAKDVQAHLVAKFPQYKTQSDLMS